MPMAGAGVLSAIFPRPHRRKSRSACPTLMPKTSWSVREASSSPAKSGPRNES